MSESGFQSKEVLAWHQRSDVRACLLLTLLWLIPAPIIGLSGEFALNDDWAYSFATERYLETGQFTRSTWTFTPIISNVAIGVIFAKVFGFSLAVLRASNLLLGWIGMLGVYAWLRSLRSSPATSALAAGLFAFNPVCLNLAYTYMTDVPFMAFVAWSLVGITWGFRYKAWLGYALGALAAVLAILSRQPGSALVVAFALTVALARVRDWRSLLLRGLMFAGSAALLLLLDRLFLARQQRAIFLLLEQSLLDQNNTFFLVENSVGTLVYLGSFIAPLVIPLLLSRRLPRWLLASSMVIAASVLLLILARFHRLPIAFNVIDVGGVGPILLHGAPSDRAILPKAVWWIQNVVGVLVASVSLVVILRWFWQKAWQERATRPEWLLPFVLIPVYFVPVALRSIFFDRHWVVLLPCVFALLLAAFDALRLERRTFFAACVGLGIMATFSVLATRDYLQHHRTRTALIDSLLRQGVAPLDIEGGFEFDGYYKFESLAKQVRRGDRMIDVPANMSFEAISKKLRTERGCQWDASTPYLVSFCPRVAGYTEIEQNSFRRLLPWTIETLRTYRRNAEPTSSADPAQPAQL